MVAAASGAVLAPYLTPQDAVTTIVTSYALLGSGLGMSLLVLAMYVHRLAICHLPEAEVCFSAADLLPLNPWSSLMPAALAQLCGCSPAD